MSEPKKVYHNYNQRIKRIFDDIEKEIQFDVAMCRQDFIMDDIFLSVTTPDGETIDHLLFNGFKK